MPSESERLVVGWFHAMRALSKRKPIPGADRIAEAIMARWVDEQITRRLDYLAERHAYDREWG